MAIVKVTVMIMERVVWPAAEPVVCCLEREDTADSISLISAPPLLVLALQLLDLLLKQVALPLVLSSHFSIIIQQLQ
jgi:hypothetical protein